MSAEVHLHDPQTLYRHWEAEQWSPWDIDLATDRDQWHGALGERDKGLVYWALSSLMVAEERITTKFAGLVMAGESEEETTFLATQQVDEARHMQFYARFRDEVIAEPETIAAHVARSREELGDSFEVIFDHALVRAHERLVAAPGDPAAKAEFVTTYHLVIEGTLVECPQVSPPAEAALAAFRLKPRERRTVPIQTIPVGGCNYPISLIVRALSLTERASKHAGRYGTADARR